MPGSSLALVEAGVHHQNSGVPAAKQSTGPMGIACLGNQGKLKGREEDSLNAIQELGWVREWLRRVRGEVNAGLVSVDAVLKTLDHDGSGPENKGSDWISKPRRKNKYKRKKALNHKVGVGSGSGPIVVKAILKPKSYMSVGVGSSAGLGLLKGPIISPRASDGPTAVKASVTSNVQTPGTFVGLGKMERPPISSKLIGLVGECQDFSEAGEQRLGNIENLPKVQPEQGIGDGKGDRPVEGTRGEGES